MKIRAQSVISVELFQNPFRQVGIKICENLSNLRVSASHTKSVESVEFRAIRVTIPLSAKIRLICVYLRPLS